MADKISNKSNTTAKFSYKTLTSSHQSHSTIIITSSSNNFIYLIKIFNKYMFQKLPILNCLPNTFVSLKFQKLLWQHIHDKLPNFILFYNQCYMSKEFVKKILHKMLHEQTVKNYLWRNISCHVVIYEKQFFSYNLLSFLRSMLEQFQINKSTWNSYLFAPTMHISPWVTFNYHNCNSWLLMSTIHIFSSVTFNHH